MESIHLFVCTTGYQLLNAISIVVAERLRADLLLISCKMREVCDMTALRKSEFFENVYESYDLMNAVSDAEVRNKAEFFLNRLKKLFYYPFVRKYANKLPNAGKSYERVYLAYMDIPNQVVYFHFKSRRGAALSLYEDGTYTYHCMETLAGTLRRTLSFLLLGGSAYRDCSEVWVRNPEHLDLGKRVTIRTRKIENSHFTEAQIERILSIYRCNATCGRRLFRKAILFDQNLEYQELRQIQREAAETLVGLYGKEQFIVKLHPAAITSDYGEGVETFSERVPFEVLMSLGAIENSVLISIFSTACFSPKIIYDLEPRIILLYKIARLDSYEFFDPSYLRLTDEVRAQYRNPDKIALPETMQELSEIIKGWANK